MQTLFDSNDYRHLNEGETYEDKFVVLQPEWLKPEYRSAKYQLFHAQSGFGCFPDKMGSKVFGRFCIDGEECSTRREYILGVATDEAIESWKTLYGKESRI